MWSDEYTFQLVLGKNGHSILSSKDERDYPDFHQQQMRNVFHGMGVHQCKWHGWFKVQGSLLFVTYTIIQGIIGSEMLVRTGPLNGKCKKEKIKHDNKIKIT